MRDPIWRTLVLLVCHPVSCSTGIFSPRQAPRAKGGPFISRPDLNPPSYSVSYSDTGAVSPGYWFVAPYQNAIEPLPCRVGPHIFDNTGQLVWSGACEFGKSNFYDFKVVEYDSTQYLTGISTGLTVEDGPGIIINNSYGLIQHISPGENATVASTNIFTLYNKGAQAVFLTSFDKKVNGSLSFDHGNQEIEARNDGISQVDLRRGLVMHEWRALDVLERSESSRPTPGGFSSIDKEPWDWIHISSLQKLSHPLQALISGRFTDTVYKLSLEQDGVMWRLGGSRSTFVCDGFNFSRQNEAQIISEEDDKVFMTIFNNAADDLESFADYSAGYIIELNIAESRAKLVQEFTRPDRGLSRIGGNMHQLENGNMFISWGDRGYITEFDSGGRPVLEASWAEPHLNTYRAYKFNFTGYSNEPIALKCFADTGKTNCFVSWNGATEVVSWEFWQLEETGKKHSLGTARKDGFETVVSMEGLLRTLAVKALSAEGNLMGWSAATETVFQGEAHPDPATVGQGPVQAVKPTEPRYEALVPHYYWLANSGWTWIVFVACLFSVALLLQKFYRFRGLAPKTKLTNVAS